ncbi:MAG TPA: hypothetical protein VHT91_45340 [Kofleriaceae bacterium]|jgi:hypothetical protein|nr:hypothetical protein [Kofleriaceae bacterium]
MRVDVLCAVSGALLLGGCGKSPATPDGTGPQPFDAAPTDGPGDVPPHMPGTPGAAAHGLAYYKLADPRYPETIASISTPKLTTAASGSTIVVSVGRGDIDKFATTVTDTAGNAPYQIQGPHAYEPAFPDSGTALYTFANAHGASAFQVTTGAGQNTKGQLDEITIAAVEVVEGSRIQDQQWNEIVQARDPVPVASRSVTTTGPATLVAFWWGDGFPGTPQSATPGNGFSLIDSNAFEIDSFVQCAVAVKNVSTAGTYSITWTSTPIQGAQLWLVAVQ